MDNKTFIPGQRWVSNTESELGLGFVVENTGRTVDLSFPASGERRTYAIDNAPVSRVIYEVGDSIQDLDGMEITITERGEQDGLVIYHGNDADGNSQTIDEMDLDSFVQFSRPQDRLFAGQIDKNNRFELRVATLEHLHKQQQSSVKGLVGPRVQLLPHQYYIASEVSRRHAPRVLLADEVGLGKTIEAGLILHHQLTSGAASRALVIVPDALVHQWLVEMLRRFNLPFTILDEDRCRALAENGDEYDDDFAADDDITAEIDAIDRSAINPFDTTQLVLCSLSFLTDNPLRQQQALEAGWDIMVVDEAHHLEWHAEQPSTAYQCVETLARAIPSLLLLTATPEQLGLESHFARLRLLDPDRYFDLAKFREEEAQYQPLSELISRLLDDADTPLVANSKLVNELHSYLGEETVQRILQESEQPTNLLIKRLLDQHGTGRVLFRNTRDAVQGFPERQLHTYSMGAAEVQTLDEDDLKKLILPEAAYLAHFGERWLSKDARIAWLTEWLSDHSDEKVLVICAQSETAQALEKYLNLRAGIRSAVFHEDMTLLARDRAAAYFAETGEEGEAGAQVLVCSEIGSEGRNFQFAHHLILFDLPLNPDLLEQRIGRLDRIGQKNTVDLHVPYYEDSPQAVQLRWYDEGLDAFSQVCATGSTVYAQVKDELHACLHDPLNAEQLEQLIEKTDTLQKALIEQLQQGRDRLLEMSSCQPDLANEMIEEVAHASSSLELASYMERVFDMFGVDHQAHSAHAVILHPGDHMLVHEFPGLSEDGATATYLRSQALSREDMQFLTWEHPMVSGAMDMLISSEQGNTAFCTIKVGGLKPGTLMLEAIFTLYATAPKQLQLQRYLPVTPIRLVVDSEGREFGDKLTFEKLNQIAKRVPLRSVQDLVRHARPQILDLVKDAEKRVKPKRDVLVDAALTKMQQAQQAEIDRLQALAEVNPAIRAEEIDYQRDSLAHLTEVIQSAGVKLDAIRVVVAM